MMTSLLRARQHMILGPDAPPPSVSPARTFWLAEACGVAGTEQQKGVALAFRMR